MRGIALPGTGWLPWVLAGLASLGLLGLAVAIAMTVGEMRIPLRVALQALGNGLFDLGYAVNPIQQGVLLDYRLSRALFAASCGGALAVCGVTLQALLRNPLAEPYLLGISAGASTGAVAVMVLGLGGAVLGVSGGALLGAILALLTVALLAAGAGGASERVILSGVAASQIFNAATATVVTTFASAEQARGVMFWLLGSLGGVRWPDVWLAAPVTLAGFAICLVHARTLDAFTFGEDAAASLGVSVPRVRLVLFGTTAAMTAIMVSIAGAVGFVGLLIPHAVRLIVGPRHSRLLPAALVTGAVFLVLADILSRVLIARQVVPIGVVTALFGAPAFALILTRVRRSA
ncbi:FecCD family ABC transporter permease [Methylobacterium aquaticum]|uniref:ABC transporter permease n=1 Tax=Methylobacterium aquaticum TaxID=270351 RepID=A0A0J6T1E3_9HYPH|nr:iron chelate uptake ABC transporter family permease subunit [Methylobacterium aquaticum]KMO39403.1 ABC transporter permease [Methylobacterium aquaticum]